LYDGKQKITVSIKKGKDNNTKKIDYSTKSNEENHNDNNKKICF